MTKAQKKGFFGRPLSPNNCAIRERTADGLIVGRCYFLVENGVCPRHGDVTEVQKRYSETGRLTDEKDHKVLFPKASP